MPGRNKNPKPAKETVSPEVYYAQVQLPGGGSVGGSRIYTPSVISAQKKQVDARLSDIQNKIQTLALYCVADQRDRFQRILRDFNANISALNTTQFQGVEHGSPLDTSAFVKIKYDKIEQWLNGWVAKYGQLINLAYEAVPEKIIRLANSGVPLTMLSKNLGPSGYFSESNQELIRMAYVEKPEGYGAQMLQTTVKNTYDRKLSNMINDLVLSDELPSDLKQQLYDFQSVEKARMNSQENTLYMKDMPASLLCGHYLSDTEVNGVSLQGHPFFSVLITELGQKEKHATKLARKQTPRTLFTFVYLPIERKEEVLPSGAVNEYLNCRVVRLETGAKTTLATLVESRGDYEEFATESPSKAIYFEAMSERRSLAPKSTGPHIVNPKLKK